MGGSKFNKKISVRVSCTYASMIVMMVMNVLFLKLIFIRHVNDAYGRYGSSVVPTDRRNR